MHITINELKLCVCACLFCCPLSHVPAHNLVGDPLITVNGSLGVVFFAYGRVLWCTLEVLLWFCVWDIVCESGYGFLGYRLCVSGGVHFCQPFLWCVVDLLLMCFLTMCKLSHGCVARFCGRLPLSLCVVSLPCNLFVTCVSRVLGASFRLALFCEWGWLRICLHCF